MYPRLALVQCWGCPRARDIFGTSLIAFGGNPDIRALYQAIGIPIVGEEMATGFRNNFRDWGSATDPK